MSRRLGKRSPSHFDRQYRYNCWTESLDRASQSGSSNGIAADSDHARSPLWLSTRHFHKKGDNATPSVVAPGLGRQAPDQLRAAMPVGLEDRHFGGVDLKADDLAQCVLAADQDGVGARKRRN